jgi:uncharacterized repeat protein (TIGR03803 family)
MAVTEMVRAASFLDGSGDLYGVTTQGGNSGDGTVFELSVPEPAGLPIVMGMLCFFMRRRKGSKIVVVSR